jgi:hypothetical protein
MRDPYDDELLADSNPEIVGLLHAADEQGWERRVHMPGRGIRVWCPCGKHNTWVDIESDDPTYVTRLRHAMIHVACLREEGHP